MHERDAQLAGDAQGRVNLLYLLLLFAFLPVAGLLLSTASFGAMATDLVIYHSWSAPPEIAALNVIKAGIEASVVVIVEREHIVSRKAANAQRTTSGFSFAALRLCG